MMADINLSNIRKLDSGLLLVFKELMELHSVTGAARSLALSQSAVSHSLARLRELLNDPLFLRRSYGLEPTRKALQLEPIVREILELTASVLNADSEFDSNNSTRLFTLAAPEFVTVSMGALLLKNLSIVAPRAGVNFAHLQPDAAYNQLRRGDVDVALGRFDRPPVKEIEVVPLYKDDYCVVVRSNHPSLPTRMTMKFYERWPHIWVSTEGEVTASEIRMDYAGYRGSLVPRWLTAITIAAQTDAIVACPRRFADSLSSSLNLRVFDLPFDHPTVDISLARRAAHIDRGAQWFEEQVKLACL